jgi:hypothetical protein
MLLTVGVAANGAPVPIGPGRPGFDPDRAVAAGFSAAEVAYDNLASPLDLYLGGFAYEEVADDVTLTGASRVLESLTVAYAGFNFDGDETLTLSLYGMDGPPTPGSFGFNSLAPCCSRGRCPSLPPRARRSRSSTLRAH